jgi:hypothetical protein
MTDDERYAAIEKRARRDEKDTTEIVWSSYEITEYTGASMRIGNLRGGATRAPCYYNALDLLWLIGKARANQTVSVED